jgi:hypothetical protein
MYFLLAKYGRIFGTLGCRESREELLAAKAEVEQQIADLKQRQDDWFRNRDLNADRPRQKISLDCAGIGYGMPADLDGIEEMVVVAEDDSPPLHWIDEHVAIAVEFQAAMSQTKE